MRYTEAENNIFINHPILCAIYHNNDDWHNIFWSYNLIENMKPLKNKNDNYYFAIVDDEGRYINLNNCNWSFTISFFSY